MLRDFLLVAQSFDHAVRLVLSISSTPCSTFDRLACLSPLVIHLFGDWDGGYREVGITGLKGHSCSIFYS